MKEINGWKANSITTSNAISNLTVTIFSIQYPKLSNKENLSCPSGGIGRRSGLKIRWPQGRGGSSPPLGTLLQIVAKECGGSFNLSH